MINVFNVTSVSSPFVAWFLVFGERFCCQERKKSPQTMKFCNLSSFLSDLEWKNYRIFKESREDNIDCLWDRVRPFASPWIFSFQGVLFFLFCLFFFGGGGGVCGWGPFFIDLLNSVPVRGLVVFWDSKQNFGTGGWSIVLLLLPIVFPFCRHQLHYTLVILFWYFNILFVVSHLKYK